MRRFENFLSMLVKQTIRAAPFLLLLASMPPAAAETVEVAPGVQVTKRTYAASINEQPFFGFAVKNERSGRLMKPS